MDPVGAVVTVNKFKWSLVLIDFPQSLYTDRGNILGGLDLTQCIQILIDLQEMFLAIF